jgi:hypothetical protein
MVVIKRKNKINCIDQFSVYGDDEHLKLIINENADINWMF